MVLNCFETIARPLGALQNVHVADGGAAKGNERPEAWDFTAETLALKKRDSCSRTDD